MVAKLKTLTWTHPMKKSTAVAAACTSPDLIHALQTAQVALDAAVVAARRNAQPNRTAILAGNLAAIADSLNFVTRRFRAGSAV